MSRGRAFERWRCLFRRCRLTSLQRWPLDWASGPARSVSCPWRWTAWNTSSRCGGRNARRWRIARPSRPGRRVPRRVARRGDHGRRIAAGATGPEYFVGPDDRLLGAPLVSRQRTVSLSRRRRNQVGDASCFPTFTAGRGAPPRPPSEHSTPATKLAMLTGRTNPVRACNADRSPQIAK